MNKIFFTKLFTLLIGVSFTAHLAAQNLVPNNSLENNSACPSGFGQLGNANAWFSPTDGNPDYFNTCVAGSGTVGIPANLFGDQDAAEGDAYAGFYAYGANNLREYVSVALSDTLTPGEQYCISFKVSRADFTYQAVENIGLYFSASPINTINGSQHLGLTPQVINQNGIITNDQGWTTITGIYTATDTMRYITIGNFNSNTNTNVTTVAFVPGVSGPFINEGYYYLDDVKVEKLPPLTIAVAPINDTFICEGETVTLVASGNGDSYQWATIFDPFTVLGTDDSLSITPDFSTSYIVTVVNGDCERTDTIDIEVLPQPTVSFSASLACVGNRVYFTDNSTNVSPDASYQWDFDNDGSIDATTGGGASTVFNTATTHQVKLTIVNNTACTTSAIIDVAVAAVCDPCSQNANLVPNPSIEAFTACPNGLGQVSFADGWFQPTEGTTDFFHACANGGDADVPNNQLGTQAAASGNGYLGFQAYGPFNYREYASAQLNQTLVPGKTYCVNFKVSMGDNTRKAVDQIGAYFSESPIAVATQTALNVVPQVSNTNGIISDKTNWTNIKGTFVATDAAQYITIGNFYENGATNVANVSGSTPEFSNFGFYYLDDVSVIELPELVVPTDTLVACAGTSLDVAASGAFCSFAWTDENGTPLGTETNINLNSTSTGIQAYTLTASLDADCSISKTVYVNWIPVPTALAAAQANCAGGITAIIDQSQNVLAGATYAWDFNNDGITDATSAGSQLYIYNAPGVYITNLTITNPNGCANTYLLPVVISATCDPCTDENNLVTNGDFEEATNCPDSLDQFGNATGWSFYDTQNNLPDLFSACDATNLVGIPANLYGNETAYNGSNYVGFSPISQIDTTQKQYLLGQLFPLTVGQTYCIKLQVSLADSARFSTDQIGMALYNGVFNTATVPLNNAVFNIIDQTNGWVELSTTFVADNGYDKLAIGNFGIYDTNIDQANAANPLNEPYYYIDGVSVTPLNIAVPDDVTVCSGTTTTLSASTNTCEAYWTVAGTGQLVATDTALTVSPTQTTTYVFTGSNGTCGISDSVTVFVNPLPSITASEVLSFCAGGAVTLDAQTNANEPTYSWTPEYNITNPNIANPNVFPDTTTTYYLTVTDGITGCTQTDSVLVVVNRLPIAGITNNTTICYGSSIQLFAEGGVSYSWSPNSSISATNVADPIVNPTETTTYTVLVTNPTGCSTTASVTVTVQQPYETTVSNISICGNVPTQLNPDVPASAVSFQWYPTTDLDNANIANPTTTTPNDLIYTLYYTDDLGCEGQAQVLVDVNPAPFAGVDVQICEGGSVQLNASGGATSYQWLPTDGLSDANVANPIASPTATTDYILTVTYSTPSGDCALTDTVRVNVASIGFANAGNNVTICQGSSTQLNAIGGDSYAWAPLTGLNDATIANPTANPSETTEYVVTVLNNTTGCTSTDTVTVFVEPSQAPILGNVSVPTCTQPSGLSFICVDLAYTGCEDLTTTISGQASGANSEPIYNNNTVCFFYLSSFLVNGNLVRNDTISVDVCTAVNNLCSTATVVLNYCDKAPTWATEQLDANTCQGQTINIALPAATDPDTDEGTLSYNIIQGNNGFATLNGTIASYTPNSNFVGNDAFNVVVCDELLPIQCDTLTISVAIQANQAPIAPSQSVTTAYNTPIDVCTGVSDADGDNLNLSGSGNANVIITGSAAGAYCIRLVPANGFVGTTTVSYTVCDPCGRCSNGTIILTVLPQVNQPPVVTPTNATITTPYQTPVTTCLNVTDPNGDDVVYDITFSPLNGDVVFNTSNNCITYTPDAGFVGNDALQFNICDENGACVTVTIAYVVLPPSTSEYPILNDVSATTPFNTPVEVCVDADEPQNEAVDYQFGTATNGTITQADSCITYTPNSGFVGNDTIQVIACDPSLNCDTANIIITVLPDNPAPTATDLTTSTNINTPVNGCFAISNLPNNETITVTLESNAVNGNVVLDANGCFTYTPNNNFVGNDQFVIQVCDAAGQCVTATGIVTVINTNTPPTAQNVTASTLVDTPVSACFGIQNLPAGEPLTITITNTVNGTVTIDNNGCFTYTPNAGFVGTDQFDVQICDQLNQCTSASATITVSANNPAPSIQNLAATTPNHTPVNGCFTFANEPSGETVTFTVTTPPANGTVTIDANGCYTYTPTGTFTGEDVFIVQICDAAGQCNTATATITVGANTPPVFNPIQIATIVSGTDTTVCFSSIVDAQGDDISVTITSIQLMVGTPPTAIGTAEIVDNCISYTSVAGFSGSVRVVVNVCDDQIPPACSSTNVEFIVINPPTTTNISATTPQGQSVQGCFDIVDLDGDATTTTIIEQPTNGTVTVAANGCVTYQPDGTFVGTDQVTVQICDDDNLCTTATYTITVTDGLIAINDAFTLEEGTTTTYNLIDNDTEPSNTIVAITNTPDNGTATVDANTGIVTYTANAGFVGTDTIVYTICDELLGCETATVIINITDLLNAADDFVTTPQNTGIDIAVLGNDNSPDTPTVSVIDEVAHGLFIDNGDGTFTYLPDVTFTGVDSFVYVISYPNYGSDTATVYINVSGAPATPNAVDDNATTDQDTPVGINIQANDIIPSGSYTTAILIQPDNGTVTYNAATGVATYTPNAGFSGTDAFTYTICHTAVTTICDQAIVTITVNPTVECVVKVYKVITPNGDNRNDYLKIDGLDCGGNDVNTLQVFNRWGNMVFEADNYNPAAFWDGTYNGNPVPDGTYFYILKVPSANIDEQGYIEVQK